MSINHFGANVRRLRQARDLTRAQLADMAGVHDCTISAVENENAAPSLLAAVRLAEALGCSVDYLLTPPAPVAAASASCQCDAHCASRAGRLTRLAQELIAGIDDLRALVLEYEAEAE